MSISKPSLTRLSRRAGIKTIASDCFPLLQNIISQKLENILTKAILLKKTKTLMLNDIYNALYFLEENLALSDSLPKNNSNELQHKVK